MKIPEISPNGPYYGNEENNGQWQGVVMESGNMVGSGDAAYHPPPPHYVRPLPAPGYVMPGVFYPPQNTYGMPPPPPQQQPDDFADYMWMENEEEFEKEVMQQLEEEALMEQCIEAMLEDERERERNNRPVTNGHANNATTSNGVNCLSLEEQVSKSTLNPLAAEFVPTFAKTTPAAQIKAENSTEESTQPQQEKPEPEPAKVDETIKPVPESDTSETPEVSALDSICNKVERRPREIKENKKQVKIEPKKVPKTEVKPKKPTEQLSKAKTEPQKLTRKKSDAVEEIKKEDIVKKNDENVQKCEESVQKCEETVQKSEDVQKKEEVVQKREEIVQKKEEVVPQKEAVVSAIESVATTAPPQEEVTIKPINYAAAAKANKSKKASPPPVQDKPVERPIVKTMDKPRIIENKSVSKLAKPERSGSKKNTAK